MVWTSRIEASPRTSPAQGAVSNPLGSPLSPPPLGLLTIRHDGPHAYAEMAYRNLMRFSNGETHLPVDEMPSLRIEGHIRDHGKPAYPRTDSGRDVGVTLRKLALC